jgi:hypothetical protein
MDKDRPSLDLKYFDDICPDKNGMSKCNFVQPGLTWRIFKVPVIAVFTKYDQFKREVRMKLEDRHCDPGANIDDEVESIFNQHYLACLRSSPLCIRLESEDSSNQLDMYYADLCPV